MSRYVVKFWMAIAIAKPALKFAKKYFWIAYNLSNKNLLVTCEFEPFEIFAPFGAP